MLNVVEFVEKRTVARDVVVAVKEVLPETMVKIEVVVFEAAEWVTVLKFFFLKNEYKDGFEKNVFLFRFEDSLETFTDLASDGVLLAERLEFDFGKRFANGTKWFGVKSFVFPLLREQNNNFSSPSNL